MTSLLLLPVAAYGAFALYMRRRHRSAAFQESVRLAQIELEAEIRALTDPDARAEFRALIH